MSAGIEIKAVEFQPGDLLFKEGEESYHFYIVQEGEVEIFRIGTDGQKISLAIVSTGNSIGEFAMLDREPRSATARALTTVRAAMISEAAYQELIADLPDWAIAVMKAMVGRVRHMNEVIRRSGMVDENTKKQIELSEFNPDGPTVIDISSLSDPHFKNS